ncbi:MAG: hypothetical protein GXO35_02465 [Gammaproteobacteria bacterium]|nr:hypothetical protein [Gammaproteobacteria bacterium]
MINKKALVQLKPNIADLSDVRLFLLELKALGVQPIEDIKPGEALSVIAAQTSLDKTQLSLIEQEARHWPSRSGIIWGYKVIGSKEAIEQLAQRSAFVLRIFSYSEFADSANKAKPAAYAILEGASKIAKKRSGARALRITCDEFYAFLTLQNANLLHFNEYMNIISTRPVGPLTHDIHYYKAKFFPRFSRALLNALASKRPGATKVKVLDPFVGSGTTLLEAFLLDLESQGIDIDPLSVLISQAKIEFLNLTPNDLEQLIDAANWASSPLNQNRSQLNAAHSDIELPKWLIKNRKMTPSAISALIEDIVFLRAFINSSPSELRNFAKVFASDAITRKVKMRILGTGSGRFSLEFAKRPIEEILLKSLTFYKEISKSVIWLKGVGLIPKKGPTANASLGDARNLSLEEDVDAILTSPPYLPASSGRESYAKHRALSLLAINGQSVNDIDALINQSIGGTTTPPDESGYFEHLFKSLSDAEKQIVLWLQKDPLRQPKAYAFAQYFYDIKKSLGAAFRALTTGGKAAFVIGKQSTFYEFSTKRPLLRVPLAEIFAESAEQIGFTVVDMIDIRLAKRTLNARPRSQDDYFETAIILQK